MEEVRFIAHLKHKEGRFVVKSFTEWQTHPNNPLHCQLPEINVRLMESSVLISCLKSVPSHFPTNPFGMFLWFPPHVSDVAFSIPILWLKGWQHVSVSFDIQLICKIQPPSSFRGLHEHFCKAQHAPTCFTEQQMTGLSVAIHNLFRSLLSFLHRTLLSCLQSPALTLQLVHVWHFSTLHWTPSQELTPPTHDFRFLLQDWKQISTTKRTSLTFRPLIKKVSVISSHVCFSMCLPACLWQSHGAKIKCTDDAQRRCVTQEVITLTEKKRWQRSGPHQTTGRRGEFSFWPTCQSVRPLCCHCPVHSVQFELLSPVFAFYQAASVCRISMNRLWLFILLAAFVALIKPELQ